MVDIHMEFRESNIGDRRVALDYGAVMEKVL